MRPLRVLVVDDSVVIRRLVSDVLSADADIEVVGTAANGRIALEKLDALRPDAVTLDIEMPVLDGLGTLRELRRSHSRLPVVMFSTLTQRGGIATLEALALGASDYVTKPSNVGSANQAMENVREQLIPKIKALCGRRTIVAPPRSAPAPRPNRPSKRVELLAIGCSTGGPEALERVLPLLPATFPVPVVVVQHMPPMFTGLLAARLNNRCALEVVEAAEGDVLRPGRVLIAPGGRHLVLRRSGGRTVVELNDDPPENFCRPAVDPMFRTAAEVYGPGVLATVLTGMGTDGRKGAEAVRSSGGSVLAQDAASSVVWGMPGAVVEAGLADQVLPLASVATGITSAVAQARTVLRS